jgi:putative FmdB family regulatory protein
MALYDYRCDDCEIEQEVTHRMDEEPHIECTTCKGGMRKIISGGAGCYKRSDAPWIKCVNGFMNDLEHVQQGRVEEITTREQARAQIKRLYADPYPRPRNSNEEAANKRVGLLRQRYTERF